MASSTSELFTSTLVVTNIHCPSCVSYAREILLPFSHVIRKVDINIIEHTIRIQHVGEYSRRLAKELVNAAFEVEHVTVMDSEGKLRRDYEMRHADTGLPRGFFADLFMSEAQRTHIKNCNACQRERTKKSAARQTWASLVRSRRAAERTSSSDLESGSTQTGSQDLSITEKPENGKDELPEAIAQSHVAILSIEGMTCASCVAAITDELRQQDFVQSVNVNLVANNAKVTFSGHSSLAERIKDLIEDIGYGAEVQEVELSNRNIDSQSVFKASLSIEGMTCGSCVGTVTRGLEELRFMRSVSVDLVSNSASVEFEGKENLHAILAKIDEIGYDASVVSCEATTSSKPKEQTEVRSVQIQIDGMYCPDCPQNITTAIDDSFSQAVTVTRTPSLAQPRLTVVYRPCLPKLSIRKIINVINSVDPAITAVVYHAPSIEERSRQIQRRERKRLLRHLLVALLIAIPTFILGVVYMSLVPSENATRQWFEQPIWAGNAMRTDWALFIMTTPAMFYSASIFHIRALKEIWTLWRPGSRVPVLRRFYRFGSMNLLISAGTAVAYFASLAVLIMDATSARQEHSMNRKSSTYFDTVTFLTLFILIGRFLEAYSKAKTGDAVSMLANLRPTTALLVDSNDDEDEKDDEESSDRNSALQKVSVDLLELGDVVSIPHGSSPPTDGIVTQDGSFLFDESSLTGESRPVKKCRDDTIMSGSVNIGDPVRIVVTEIGGKSMLDQIVNAVREGQSKRAPIERLADILTGYFTPVITLLAISTWVIWLALGESGVLPAGWLDVERGGWPFWSVEFAIAVFVVACPCGIGLAAPTALFVGGGLAAKNGILVQGGGEAFQEASRLDAVVFDKTGTLTEGRMQVTEVDFVRQKDQNQEQIALLATKALEESSTHPIARAIVRYCDEALEIHAKYSIKTLDIKEIPGQGMSGVFEIVHEGQTLVYEAAIGNERLLKTLSERTKPPATVGSEKQAQVITSNVFANTTLLRYQNQGNSTAVLMLRQRTNSTSQNCSIAAVFAITDPLREEAPSVIRSLRSLGLEVYMCTGDNVQTAEAIAAQLNIPSSNIRAGVLPQGKAAFIDELQNNTIDEGHQSLKRKIVAFVGDGTNDTPALTVSDVSIALSHSDESGGASGSDIALTSSSFVLLNSNLSSILTLIKLSRRVFLRVKLNFVWAAIYNICLVPVAAGIFFPVGATWGNNAHGGFRLNPVWASLAMAGSSVSVVLSSLALRLPELELRRIRK